MSMISHVVLTGGVGSRLWPLSRQSKPKQYLEIFSESSLFELAVKRNAIYCQELIVVGNQGNKRLSENVLAKLGITSFKNISEAASRNTAPAIAFAAFNSGPEDILLITPADHLIEGGEAYGSAIERAVKLAKENFLVTFGVKPDKPNSGYGYIEHAQEDVISFREKPDKETAENFLRKGSFLWNSGMFCFKAGVYLEELQKYHPEVFKKSLDAWERAENGDLECFSSLKIPSISIDYAVMEKSKNIKVVEAEFKWSDMGCFEAIYNYLREQGHTTDLNKNMQIGEIKPTFFVGLHDCILVSTKDVNLVVSKEASQDVKTIYQDLQQSNPELVK